MGESMNAKDCGSQEKGVGDIKEELKKDSCVRPSVEIQTRGRRDLPPLKPKCQYFLYKS